jgi:hypothetical protein
MGLVIGQNKRSATLQGRAPFRYEGTASHYGIATGFALAMTTISGTRLKPRTTFLAGHCRSAILHLILVVRPFRVAPMHEAKASHYISSSAPIRGAEVTHKSLRFLRELDEASHYGIATGFALAMTAFLLGHCEAC